jgi:hypothetical protein
LAGNDIISRSCDVILAGNAITLGTDDVILDRK